MPCACRGPRHPGWHARYGPCVGLVLTDGAWATLRCCCQWPVARRVRYAAHEIPRRRPWAWSTVRLAARVASHLASVWLAAACRRCVPDVEVRRPQRQRLRCPRPGLPRKRLGRPHLRRRGLTDLAAPSLGCWSTPLASTVWICRAPRPACGRPMRAPERQAPRSCRRWI